VSRARLFGVLFCAAASLALYGTMLDVVRGLDAAWPSHAWELFGWVEPLPRPRPNRAELHALAVGPFLALILALFALYGLAVALLTGRRSARLEWVVFAAGALFLLVQTFGSALLSSDVYNYVSYGRIFAVYGGDPYVQPPERFARDPYLRLLAWRDVPSVYGPLWTLLSGGLALLGGERVGLTVLLYRLAGGAAALGTAALAWACLRRLAPEQAALGLALFLWNPLVVLESGLSAHNDVLMAMLLALAVWLHLSGRPTLAPAAIVLSALVKFASGLLLPLYVLLVLRKREGWRARARYLAASGAVVAISLALVLLPTRLGSATRPLPALTSDAERYGNSLHELAFAALRLHFGEAPTVARAPWQRAEWLGQPAPSAGPSAATAQANVWLRAMNWLAFLTFWLYAARRIVDVRSFLCWSVAVLLASYWLVATVIFPWYLVWALALAAVVPTSRATLLAVLLSATVLSLYALGGFDDETSPLWWVKAYRSIPALVLPLLIFAGVELWRRIRPADRGNLAGRTWTRRPTIRRRSSA
jgi:hypothetical protein